MAGCSSKECFSKHRTNDTPVCINRINCDNKLRRYTILEIKPNDNFFEIIVSDIDGNKYKVITSDDVDVKAVQNGTKIEIGKSYLLHLVSIDDLLGISNPIPGMEISYVFGDTRIDTNPSEGIFTIYYTKELRGEYYFQN